MTEETLTAIMTGLAAITSSLFTFFGTKYYEKKKAGVEIEQLKTKNSILEEEYNSKVLTSNMGLFERVDKLQQHVSEQNSVMFQLKQELADFKIEMANIKIENSRLKANNKLLHEENIEISKLLKEYKESLDRFKKRYEEKDEENRQLKLKLNS